MKIKCMLLAAVVALAVPGTAQAQMRALSDPVVPHPDPESLFTSDDPVLHRNKQAALHIMRELLQCNQWHRAGEWLTDLRLFDVYQGKGIDPHRKSLAVGLTWQHPSRTLNDDEVNSTTQNILTSLEQRLNATLRK